MISADLIPQLNTDTVLSPSLRRSSTSDSAMFLYKVDFVRINRVETVGGGANYVVESFLQRPQSHIPTRAQCGKRVRYVATDNLQREVAARCAPFNGTQQQPDRVTMYPFSAFEELRRAISALVDKEYRGRCFPCVEWMTFETFTMTKASLMMKIVPTTNVRMRKLEMFLNSAVLLATQTTVRPEMRQQCDLFDAVGKLIADFLQGQ